ncbi:MAG: type II secretion system protein GspM [Casimicrobiaceae bacterium]|nr:type II secretion system protein GspM [Casimicrobiaceae bacterium]
MKLPTGARGVTAAWLLALACAAAGVAAIALPAWWAWKRYEDIAADAQAKIDRYRKLTVNREDYLRALEAVKAREASRFFLKNTAATQAGSELTDLVRAAIESNGARLTSIQPATVREDSGYRLYSLPIGFVATPANLAKVLLALETTVPYLFLEAVTLRATVPRGYKGVPNVEPEVSVTLEVQAYGFRDASRAAGTRSGAAAPAMAPGATSVAPTARSEVAPR